MPFCWTTSSLLDVGIYKYHIEATYRADDGTTGSAVPLDLLFTVTNQDPVVSTPIIVTPTAIGESATVSFSLKDPDGSIALVEWQLISAPNPGSVIQEQPPVLENNGFTKYSIKIPYVDERDIGSWHVQIAVDDDKGQRRTGSASFTFPNIAPTVAIDGARFVQAFNTIGLSANVRDPDGGPVPTLSWSIIQSPTGSSITAPQSAYSSASSIAIPTAARDIGIWRIGLSARDNEGDERYSEAGVVVTGPCVSPDVGGRPPRDSSGQLIVDAIGVIPPFEVIHTYSKEQIKKMRGPPVPAGKVRLGLTQPDPKRQEVSYKANFINKPSAGGICYWTSNWKLKLELPLRVYIASELPVNTCPYDAVFGHELKHVSVDKNIVERTTNKMKEALEAAGFPQKNSALFVPDVAAGDSQVNERVKSILAPLYLEYRKGLNAANAAVDTNQEYERVRSLCPDLEWTRYL